MSIRTYAFAVTRTQPTPPPSPTPRGSSARGPVVRELGPETAGAFCELMQEAFSEYRDKDAPSGALLETPESVERELAEGTILLGIWDPEAAGAPRLLAGMKATRSRTRLLQFARLSVLPGHRGEGLVRLLLQAAQERSRAQGLRGIGCTVRRDETALISMYEHLGLEVTGEGVHQSLTGRVIPVVQMRRRLEDAPRSVRGPALADVLGSAGDRPGTSES